MKEQLHIGAVKWSGGPVWWSCLHLPEYLSEVILSISVLTLTINCQPATHQTKTHSKFL